VTFSIGSLVEIENPVSASQAWFQQTHIIERFASQAATNAVIVRKVLKIFYWSHLKTVHIVIFGIAQIASRFFHFPQLLTMGENGLKSGFGLGTRISWIRPCACILLCNVAMLKLVNFFSQKKSWESVNQQYYKFSATAQHKNCASSTFDDGPGRDLFRVLKRSPIPRPHALVLRWTCSDGKVQEATRRDSDEDCIHTGCGKKVSMVFVGKYLQAKVAQKLVGQVCGNSDKNPSHPQKFSCSYTSAWRCASCPDQKTIYVKL